MCLDMCLDIFRDVFGHVWTCVWTCLDMCLDMFFDMCLDMFFDMCLDMFRHVVSSCSGDREFVSLGVQEMESSVTGSNPGSLLRSKSTRRERRCVAESSRLVILKYYVLEAKPFGAVRPQQQAIRS